MKENHILPFLWMRGESEDILRTELKKIREAGIRSVCLEARPHPDYAGEGWWHDVDIVIDEAKKHDMQIWILDDAHFPTGMANGSMAAHPDKARRFLYTNFVDATGPLPAAQFDVDTLLTKQVTWMDLGKPVSTPLFDETKLLSVTASRISDGDTVEGEILDLTSSVSDGYLTWDVPEGVWRINVNFSTTAIGPKPDYINYIDEDSVRVLIDEVYEKHYARYKDLFGTIIQGFFSDEPGFYNRDTYDEFSDLGRFDALPWGSEMNILLHNIYEGDLYRDLPLLFANEKNGAHRAVRYAYMDAVSRLYSKNFSCQLGEWCRAHGVRYIGHIVEDNYAYKRLGAGVGHYFRAMAGQDIAGIDNIGYQLMPGNDVAIRHTGAQDISPEFYHYGIGRLGASAAAIDPLKKGRLMCENFGAYGWRLGVRDMKWLADYLIAQGVNYFVPHAFSMAEYPDSDCPPHFHARGNNPEYPYFCDLMRYTDRLSNLFSDGQSVPGAAVLFEAEADWTGKAMHGCTVGKELITHQVDFFFIPADVFADPAYYGCEVSDGKLIVNGYSMNAFVVPECEFIPAKAASFIADHPDLPVFYVNHFPKGIAGPCENAEELLKNALRNRTCVPLPELGDVLRGEGCADELFTERSVPCLRQYHYRKDGRDFWMLMNTSLNLNVEETFHLPKAASFGIYDAMKDQTTALSVSDGTASLRIAPYESLILVKDPEIAEPAEPEYKLCGQLPLQTFDLTLVPIGSGEEEVIKGFDPKPVSSIRRDFSGTIIYRTKFLISELPKKAVFNAEYVFECMSVELNGKTLPNVIAPPYTADLTEALKEGANELCIRVATTPLRDANTKPGIFGKERTVIEPTGMFGQIRIDLFL